MSTKVITYPSGTIVRRKIKGNDETWELEGKALSTSVFNIDLTNCKGISFSDGDEDDITREITVPCLKKKELFRIKKVPPYTFAPQFRLKEEPIPLEEQLEHTADEREKVEEIIERIEELFKEIPFEVMSEDQIKKSIRKFDIDHFVDPHFPPRDTSIHWITDPYPYKQIVHWRRPHEFMKDPKIFEDDIDPNDIKQGFLPDCWFLSALSSLAERPDLVRRLIITQEYNKEGIYKVRLCKNGEWQTITIDDYIPWYYNGGPMFSRGNGDELWVILLEKAYAKMHGCYYSLRYGYTHHGMLDLTGCPTWNIKFPEHKPDFETVEERAEEIWDEIKKADDMGFLISGDTPGHDDATEGGQLDAPSGLVPGHAYSIIQAKEGLGERLLNIRNPWGKYEWDGDWSDTSDLWTQDMIDHFNPIFDVNDGSFWMCLEDFILRFDSVNIWEVKNWNEARVKGKFITAEEKNGNKWVVPKFYYSFTVEDDDTEIYFGVHQEDDRVLGADRRKLLDISFVLFQIDDDNEELEVIRSPEFVVEREAQTKVELDEGKYILVPLTTGALLQKPLEASEDELDLRVVFNGIQMPHPFFLTTLNDIFRKIDLSLEVKSNGGKKSSKKKEDPALMGCTKLSHEELNQFGDIIDEPKFQDLTPQSFTSKEFKKISWDQGGLTNLGFKQYLFRNFDDERLKEMFETLGYDDGLYSTKSRVFVVSIQASTELNVEINESFLGDLHLRTWDLYLNDKLVSNEISQDRIKTRNYLFFRVDHSACYGWSYGLANKTNKWQLVELDMTQSLNWYFAPFDGSSSVLVPPKGLKYLGSSMSNPEAEDFTFSRSFTVRTVPAPDNGEDSEEGEGDSEGEGSSEEEESSNEESSGENPGSESE